jgi:hypothetical protein
MHKSSNTELLNEIIFLLGCKERYRRDLSSSMSAKPTKKNGARNLLHRGPSFEERVWARQVLVRRWARDRPKCGAHGSSDIAIEFEDGFSEFVVEIELVAEFW